MALGLCRRPAVRLTMGLPKFSGVPLMLSMRIPGLPKSESRIKAEMAEVESLCQTILTRFDGLGRAPTLAERDERRLDFLASRKRLGELGTQLLAIKCS
jgi:hypothetical protein